MTDKTKDVQSTNDGDSSHLLDRLVGLLPAHKAGLHLEHNEHKNYYESVEQWLSNLDEMYDWKDEASRQRAIDTDSVWTLQWYPDTPGGFYAVAAPTLGELLLLANSQLSCEAKRSHD